MPQTTNSEGLLIGVDVGGTKVAAGFVSAEGKITNQVRTAMVADRDAASGFAGPLDPQTGVVINPPNLPCWRNFPLASEMSRLYRLPVKVDNDANAAGLAERFGAPEPGIEMPSTQPSEPASARESFLMVGSIMAAPEQRAKAVI